MASVQKVAEEAHDARSVVRVLPVEQLQQLELRLGLRVGEARGRRGRVSGAARRGGGCNWAERARRGGANKPARRARAQARRRAAAPTLHAAPARPSAQVAARTCWRKGFFDLMILIATKQPLTVSYAFTTCTRQPDTPAGHARRRRRQQQQKEARRRGARHGRAGERTARQAGPGQARAGLGRAASPARTRARDAAQHSRAPRGRSRRPAAASGWARVPRSRPSRARPLSRARTWPKLPLPIGPSTVYRLANVSPGVTM